MDDFGLNLSISGPEELIILRLKYFELSIYECKESLMLFIIYYLWRNCVLISQIFNKKLENFLRLHYVTN